MSAVTRPDEPIGDRGDFEHHQTMRRPPPDDPEAYAPRWLREGVTRARNVVAMRLPEAPQLSMRPREAEDEPPHPRDRAGDPDLGVRPDPEWPRAGAVEWARPTYLSRGTREARFEGDRDVRRLWRQQSLAPTAVPEPPVRERPPGELSLGAYLRLGGSVAAAVLAALVVVGAFAMPDFGSRGTAVAPRPPAAPVKAAARAEDAWPGTPARPAARSTPAVQDIDAPARVQTVMVTARPPEPATSGLAPPALPAVTPPPAEQAPPPPAPAAPPVPATPVAVAPTIDGEELARMVKRGEEFVSQGDLSAARLILRRAANAGEMRAALVLGATFDPTVLRQLRVMGFKPDVASARNWYQKAAQSGSAEAARRLTVLATLSE